MLEKLWNKNFSYAIIGNILSAIGGIGLQIALSVIVFDLTSSTLMTALFSITTTVPSLVMPLISGAFIDRRNPLKVLLRNESLLMIVFLISSVITYYTALNYVMLLFIGITISIFSSVSSLATESVMAQLMNIKNYSKGYAVINIINPLSSVLITPLAMRIFQDYGISIIFFLYSVLTLLDIVIESKIDHNFEYLNGDHQALAVYVEDSKSGLKYIKENQGIKYIFILFSVIMFASTADSLIYPIFTHSATLTTQDYATLRSLTSLGYLLGGLIHYFVDFKKVDRYQMALMIYLIFVVGDILFIISPLPVMIIIKIILGICGMNSANIRNSAVQSEVPNQFRGKVNAVFSIMISIATMLGEFTVGLLGDYLPLKPLFIAMQIVYLCAILCIYIPKKKYIEPIYNYEEKARLS